MDPKGYEVDEEFWETTTKVAKGSGIINNQIKEEHLLDLNFGDIRVFTSNYNEKQNK